MSRDAAEALELLGRIRASTSSAEEQRLLDLAFDALLFIRATAQFHSLEDYRKELDANDPPPVVARFGTREEAQAWLEHHPHPPQGAHVLIGDDYHLVVYEREANLRRLPATPTMENCLARLGHIEPPVATHTFDTREQAQAWLESLDAPPRKTWVLIAGELHLAVYHPHVDHRALYPLSRAEQDEGEDEA